MATLTKQQIANFVAANIGDPNAIASAAAQYGVTSDQIADAIGTNVSNVQNYFSNAGVDAPPITPPTPALQFQSSNTGGAVGQATGQASQAQISQIASSAPDLVNALQSGNVGITSDADGNTTLYNKATGQGLSGYEYIQTQPDGTVQINIATPGGYVSAVTSANQQGTLAPVKAENVYSATKAAPDSGGLLNQIGLSAANINAKTVLAAGLAYALPIAGQALAASLGTSTAVGTAIAATAAGVAQGQDPLTAAKNALPSLIAANVISNDDASNFLKSISSDTTTQAAITAAATSAVKTAAAGGSASDIFNNMATSVAGTELGNVTGSQTLGQGVASTLATGSAGAGLTAAAGAAGQQQAATNAAGRTSAATTAIANDIQNLNQQLYTASSSAFALPELGPQATQAVTDLTNQILSKYQQAVLNPQTTAQELETLFQAATKYINPAVVGKALGTIGMLLLSTNAGDPNEQAIIDSKYKVIQNQAAQTPTTPTISTAIDLGTVGGSATEPLPVTADVANVAKSLNISTNEALQLQQTNPNLFKNISGTGTEPAFVPANPETMRSTDLVIGQGAGAGDNVILSSGKTPTTSLQSPVSTPQVTTPQDSLVITTDPATQTALVITPSGQISIVSTENQQVTPGETVQVDPTANVVVSTVASQQIASKPTTQTATQTTTNTASVIVPSANVATNTASVSIPASNVATNTSTQIQPLSNVATNTSSLVLPLANTATNTSSLVQPLTNTSNITANVPTSNITSNVAYIPPGNVVIPPGGSNNAANVIITASNYNNVANVASSNISNVSPNVVITTGGVTNVTNNVSNIASNVSNNANVVITTSYVKPKSTSVLPSIVGQFNNPLIASPSAYIPAGAIPDPETGKVREDVWNTESLREGLGI